VLGADASNVRLTQFLNVSNVTINLIFVRTGGGITGECSAIQSGNVILCHDISSSVMAAK